MLEKILKISIMQEEKITIDEEEYFDNLTQLVEVGTALISITLAGFLEDLFHYLDLDVTPYN